jgi:Na+-translocating ferredoxin:NAD+ oxidoreductase subunit B
MSGSQKYPGLPLLPPSFAATQPPLAKVLEEKCIVCDRCLPVCFFDALCLEERPGHPHGRSAVVIASHCTGCGLCFEACPVDAFVWVPDMSSSPSRPGSRL